MSFCYTDFLYITVRNPKSISTLGLASFAFARHYSQNLGWFLFLCLLRCFSSAGSLGIPMYSVYRNTSSMCWVSSFGHPRIEAYLQLPVAYRSLSRPSSAPSAKAFSLRSFSLELSLISVLFSITWVSQIGYVVFPVSLRCSFPFFQLFRKTNLYRFFFSVFSICFSLFDFQCTSYRFHSSLLLCSLVGPSGLEPPTSCLSGTRSNHLSYEPMWIFGVVEMKGFEPLTPCLQGRCSPNWATPPDYSWDFAFLRFFLTLGVSISSLPGLVSALSYLPAQLPVKYCHHCRA